MLDLAIPPLALSIIYAFVHFLLSQPGVLAASSRIAVALCVLWSDACAMQGMNFGEWAVRYDRRG